MEIMPKRHDHRPEINARLAAERTPKRKEPLDRLTRDSIAAEQAGMSYGQYKALHPHTPDEDETPPKPKTDPGRYEFICQTCGKVYYKTNMARQKYCGDYCRSVAKSQRDAVHRKQKRLEEKAND